MLDSTLLYYLINRETSKGDALPEIVKVKLSLCHNLNVHAEIHPQCQV
jgi:hypothetical protein